MSVLPKDAAGFSDPAYWKNFFKQQKSPFEWYGDYDTLAPAVSKYLKVSDSIFQIGCGNSQLAAQLYENGYRNVRSIDVEDSVVKDQRVRNKERPGLTFDVGDATNMDAADESYSVVLDKGTMDALLPPDADEQTTLNVTRMLDEVCRVLQSGGRYLLVTLAQPHIVDLWVNYLYQKNQYILRVHKVENKASGFQMPVFVLVATKLRIAGAFKPPMEVCRSGSETMERVESVEGIKASIREEQELSQFIHHCSEKLADEASIDFQGDKPELGYRFRLYVVDRPTANKIGTFAAFIVPIGRDVEWIFASEKGRMALRLQCDVDRLVIVFLNRRQYYEGVQEIKAELGHFITLLDNREKDPGVFKLLSIGEVDIKRTLVGGTSEVNGKWEVEEVDVSGKTYRRLVFLSTLNLVQSEALTGEGKKGKKKILLDYLSCEFHQMMVAGLALLPHNPLAKTDQPLKFAVLGLGGGLLAAYLLRQFKQASVIGVELDHDVIKIAADFFSFPLSDPRMKVKCMNALDFIRDVSEAGPSEKCDAIFVDIAGSSDEIGLCCPTPQFLEPQVLEQMKKALKPKGALLINLVTRDDSISLRTKETVAGVFPTLHVLRSCEDVNEVLIGQSQLKDTPVAPQELTKKISRNLGSVNDIVDSLMRIHRFRL
ncbi:unnamed protein product [Caenorhabditis auriculariae]|uniref:Methyltransferase domain-containing protein n=1 Tax=Caenorhabditis auriculariae TaxID=2777116 RepID=A0A8S1H773_9PELO|nr:unnamed protein product [Caenorhabditis auriculariae]